MAERPRVMQSADRRDHVAVLFQGLERPRKLVILARRGDLVIERMDAVRQVDESATPRRGGGFLLRSERDHAFQHGEGDESAQRFEGMAAVD